MKMYNQKHKNKNETKIISVGTFTQTESVLEGDSLLLNMPKNLHIIIQFNSMQCN
jgi:hypothetical protein